MTTDTLTADPFLPLALHADEAGDDEAELARRWLVAADWLDDRDDPRGAAVRWMVREGWKPDEGTDEDAAGVAVRVFDWWRPGCRFDPVAGKANILPEEVFACLAGYDEYMSSMRSAWCSYLSRLAAILALLDAYVTAVRARRKDVANADH